MNEEKEEFKLEPVEIHPEMYKTDLFGTPTKEIASAFTLSTGAPTASESLPSPSFNIFALTDAIGARKKRDAWVLYMKALAAGTAPDEIFYKLFWQFKTMMLASKTKTAEEADMKSFPYNKAKGFLKNFSTSELQNLSTDLILGYHRARRGEGEIETLVEKTLLKL
jgi:DNA polymerase III delta subunit